MATTGGWRPFLSGIRERRRDGMDVERRRFGYVPTVVVAFHGVGLGATLVLPWVHDEAGRATGWRVLLGQLDGSTDGFWPLVAAVSVAVATVVALVAMASGLIGGSDHEGRGDPPDDGRWVAAWWIQRSRTPLPRDQVWARRALVSCGLAALLTGRLALRLGRRADVGVPSAIVIACAGVVLWGLLRLWSRASPAAVDRPAWRRRGVAAAAVAAVAVVAAAVGAPWWTTSRHVDATTTSRPMSGRAGGPEEVHGVAWSVAADEVVVADLAVVVLRGGQVAVLDAATGAERWHYRPDDGLATARVSDSEGVVVVSTWLDRGLYDLVALDLASGEERWRRRVVGALVQVIDELVFVAETDPVGLAALNAADGTLAWHRPDQGLGFHSPESWRRSGNALVGIGPGGGRLVALDRSSGDLLWEIDAREQVDFLPHEVVADVEGMVTVAATVSSDSDGNGLQPGLIALDAATGRELWREHVGSTVTDPVVVDGRLVVGINQDDDAGLDRLVAHDPRSGAPAWSSDLDNDLHDHAVLALGSDGDRVYLATGTDGGRDSTLLVLDAGGQLLDETTVAGCATPCRAGAVVLEGGAGSSDGAVLLPTGGVLVNATGDSTGERSLIWYLEDAIAQVTVIN
jgi:outer membrane protein assembly factor BamB